MRVAANVFHRNIRTHLPRYSIPGAFTYPSRVRGYGMLVARNCEVERTMSQLERAVAPSVSASCSIALCDRPAKTTGLCYLHYARKRRHGDPNAGRPVRSVVYNFLNDFVLPFRNTDVCISWPFSPTKKLGGITNTMMRYVCRLTKGEPPTEEHEVAHSCGNGHHSCVNPHHLSWKTHADNMDDKKIHGTIVRGQKVNTSKLSPEQVLRIRDRIKSGELVAALAQEYNVRPVNIHRAYTGQNWGWLK